MEERNSNVTKVICLLVKTGPLEGHQYFVKTDSPILIGRSEDANIRVAYDEFCSRRHAIVSWEKDACYIEDLKSTNGTSINKTRIESKTKLNNRDVISFGSTDAVVLISEASQKRKTSSDDEVVYDD